MDLTTSHIEKLGLFAYSQTPFCFENVLQDFQVNDSCYYVDVYYIWAVDDHDDLAGGQTGKLVPQFPWSQARNHTITTAGCG
jgi:hypothetical protein